MRGIRGLEREDRDERVVFFFFLRKDERVVGVRERLKINNDVTSRLSLRSEMVNLIIVWIWLVLT